MERALAGSNAPQPSRAEARAWAARGEAVRDLWLILTVICAFAAIISLLFALLFAVPMVVRDPIGFVVELCDFRAAARGADAWLSETRLAAGVPLACGVLAWWFHRLYQRCLATPRGAVSKPSPRQAASLEDDPCRDRR